MSLQEFLGFLLTGAGAGIAVFAVVEYLNKLTNISSEAKFWLAIVLAWLIPPLAYFTQVWMGWDVLSAEGAFGAVAISYIVSQGIHRQVEKNELDRGGYEHE